MTGRSRRTARVTGASASLILAVGLAAGCAGGEPGEEKSAHAGGTKPSAVASPSPGASAAKAQAPATPSPGEAGRNSAAPRTSSAGPVVPKLPTDELTPATGSFTQKEKRYLEGRVPRGIDPASVLVSGKDTCQRITRTADVDRAAAVDAIRSGEIGGAKAAIKHLCPQHEGLLREAQS